MIGEVLIRLPKLPEPTVPDGFELSGFEVMYDGPSHAMREGRTVADAADMLERELCDCFRVYADCTEVGGTGEQTCEWDSRSRKWLPWEWK